VSLRVVDTDRYGRTVAEILKGRQNVNLQMVRRGQAFAYRQYLRNCDAAAYLGAERGAEVDRLGVWSTPGGIQRPWDFRHGRRGYRPAVSLPSYARHYPLSHPGQHFGTSHKQENLDPED
jgi:endonuclease YncB( thermonuclease family)